MGFAKPAKTGVNALLSSTHPTGFGQVLLPQHHQRIERQRALRRRHERIDVDALDAVAEIVRKAAEPQHGGEHALPVGRLFGGLIVAANPSRYCWG